MATDASAGSLPVTDFSLSFAQTVDRRLVHRRAVSEVFLTDVRAVGATRVLVGAQLPTCHGYFDDRADEGVRAGSAVDALLVMEICRQASLASAHELGVPTDTILISAELDLDITDPEAWRTAGDSGEVRIDVEYTWTRVRRGRPRAGVCDQRVVVGGVLAARHRSSGTLLSRADMANLRAAQRGTPPQWTDDLVDAPVPDAVPPAAVGRRDPRNVVLARVHHDGAGLAARLAPRWSNRAFFDHSYDHLTMQVLTEAARQLALLRVGDTFANRELTGLAGTFSSFAELDADVMVRAGGPDPGGRRVPVTIEQSGATVAELTLTFAGDGDRA